MRDAIRNTFRFFRRERLLSATILSTLTLGIGINVAIFSVLDVVLIRPLPFPAADRLVAVWQHDRKDGSNFVVSAANYLDWQKQSRVFQSLCAVQQFRDREFNLMAGDMPASVPGVRISPTCFAVLRAYPIRGRAIAAEDARPGAGPVVVLGYEAWVNRFGGDPSAIGKEIRVNGEAARIIGVMPKGFAIPLVPAQIYLALAWTPAECQERRVANYLVLGRLRDGVDMQSATMRMAAFARSLDERYPDSNKDVGIEINPLQGVESGPVRPVLLAIFCGSGCVLLLACLNLANLFGSRGISRRREIAIRISLGATLARLIRQFLAEGLIISGIGCVLGVVCGMGLVRGLLSLFHNSVYLSLPRRREIELNWHVVAFAALACILSANLFAFAGIARALKTDFSSAAARMGSRQDGRIRAAFLMAEVGFSVALVIATGLLVRSDLRLHAEKLGFSAKGVIAATIALPESRYSTPEHRLAFFRRLLTEAAGMPGVNAASAVRFLPLSGVAAVWSISAEDGSSQNFPGAFHHIVAPGYFAVMGIPVLAGRTFDESNRAGRTRVVILSQTAATRYFPNDPDPIGKYLRIEDEQHALWRVIGIVGDVRNLRADLAPRPQVYVPMEQSPAGTMTLLIRTSQNSAGVGADLRALVQRIDRFQGITDVRSVSEFVDDAAARWRVATNVFGFFGGAGVLLALSGLYGLVSYNVAQRTREIAIRVALGGSRARIIRMLLYPPLAIFAVGLAPGALLAWAAGHMLRSLLYGIAPLDAATFVASGLGFLAVGLAAAAVAASRATRIDPATALKQE